MLIGTKSYSMIVSFPYGYVNLPMVLDPVTGTILHRAARGSFSAALERETRISLPDRLRRAQFLVPQGRKKPYFSHYENFWLVNERNYLFLKENFGNKLEFAPVSCRQMPYRNSYSQEQEETQTSAYWLVKVMHRVDAIDPHESGYYYDMNGRRCDGCHRNGGVFRPLASEWSLKDNWWEMEEYPPDPVSLDVFVFKQNCDPGPIFVADGFPAVVFMEDELATVLKGYHGFEVVRFTSSSPNWEQSRMLYEQR